MKYSQLCLTQLTIFQFILKYFLLNQQEKKKETVSVSTHKNVFWTCAIREESRERTGNNREQDFFALIFVSKESEPMTLLLVAESKQTFP